MQEYIEKWQFYVIIVYTSTTSGDRIFVRRDSMCISQVKKVIDESSNIVCLCGLGMDTESGYSNLRSDEAAYRIESKYKYSPEDLLSSLFFTVRTKQFFKFYKEEILSQQRAPNEGHYALAQLEKRGKLKAVITRSVYELFQQAGCEQVIEILGSIYINKCPQCEKEYSMDYIKDSHSVPLCEECQTAIRPGVCLYGEMVNNQIITKTAESIDKADVLMVLGTNLKSRLCQERLQYYKGNKLILVNDEEHYSDNYADYVIHGQVKEILPLLI